MTPSQQARLHAVTLADQAVEERLMAHAEAELQKLALQAAECKPEARP